MMKLNITKWPWWVKGGLWGIGFYVFVVIFLLGTLMIPEKWLLQVAPGSLSFLRYFLMLAFYPAMFLTNNYENLSFIIPLNLLFYCLVGVLITFVVKAVKEGVELV